MINVLSQFRCVCVCVCVCVRVCMCALWKWDVQEVGVITRDAMGEQQVKQAK